MTYYMDSNVNIKIIGTQMQKTKPKIRTIRSHPIDSVFANRSPIWHSKNFHQGVQPLTVCIGTERRGSWSQGTTPTSLRWKIDYPKMVSSVLEGNKPTQSNLICKTSSNNLIRYPFFLLPRATDLLPRAQQNSMHGTTSGPRQPHGRNPRCNSTTPKPTDRNF